MLIDVKDLGEFAAPMEFSFAIWQRDGSTDIKRDRWKITGEDEITSWSGVMLDDILCSPRLYWCRDDYVSITAIASAGYSIEIAKEELNRCHCRPEKF
jgi:hypothetical protein